MNILIAKLGATGDVVRTTTLLSQFHDHVSWITEAKNAMLLRSFPIACDVSHGRNERP